MLALTQAASRIGVVYFCLRLAGRFTPVAIHTAQAVRHRLWWLLATTVLCGLGETIGWGGRLWSSEDLWNRTPFMIQ